MELNLLRGGQELFQVFLTGRFLRRMRVKQTAITEHKYFKGY